MSTLYMHATKEKVAPRVIFSGDPWRVDKLKNYLENPEHVGFHREYNTYTGTYKGVPVTVTSTGIGSPSAAIAMEEMYETGMKVALRMGTVMSLRDDLLGQFIVPSASMRRDGTSRTYAPLEFPAAADVGLVETINETVSAHGKLVSNGLNCTMDGFYSQMKASKLAMERGTDLEKSFDELEALGIEGVDMESAAMMVAGRLMGVRTAVLTLVTVLRNLKGTMKDDDREEAEDLLCRIALESMVNDAQKEGDTQ